MSYRIYVLGFGSTPVGEGEVKIVSCGPIVRGMRPLRETGAMRLVVPDDIAGAFTIQRVECSRGVAMPHRLLPGDEVRLTVRNVTRSPWYLRLLAAVGLRRRAIRFTACLMGEADEAAPALSRDEEPRPADPRSV